LLVIHRDTSLLEHRYFADLLDYLDPGDCLVLNETKVLPARLLGVREGSGGKVEILLVRDLGEGRWQFLIRPARRARIGDCLLFGDGQLSCRLEEPLDSGEWVGQFHTTEDLEDNLARLGQVPLPPYIRRSPEESDRERYQTVYAKHCGAVAAPTAGLHFTNDLLERLAAKGVDLVPILLHVGPGTFRPVTEMVISRHRMEAEYYHIPPLAAQRVNDIRHRGGRIFAVGTTTVRALETSVVETKGSEKLEPGEGWTNLFIFPPFLFRATDALITNFHLPGSTLLMLVSAFAGRELVLRAYREAIDKRYLFYSYGDAMLIL